MLERQRHDEIAYWKTLTPQGRARAIERKNIEIKQIDEQKELTPAMKERREHLLDDLLYIRMASLEADPPFDNEPV